MKNVFLILSILGLASTISLGEVKEVKKKNNNTYSVFCTDKTYGMVDITRDSICASNSFTSIKVCKIKSSWDINSAANTACSGEANKARKCTIKKGSYVYTKRVGDESIEYALSGQMGQDRAYMASIAGKAWVGETRGTGKMICVSQYKKPNLLDNYWKIKDKSNNIYYTRSKNIK